MVERLYPDLRTPRLERGVSALAASLNWIATVNDYVAAHTQNPKPFIWTAKATDVPAKVIRANDWHLPNSRNSNSLQIRFLCDSTGKEYGKNPCFH